MRLSENGKTLWIRLPESAQKPINGGCSCGCKSPAMWDTLAVCTKTGQSILIHYPQLTPENLSINRKS